MGVVWAQDLAAAAEGVVVQIAGGLDLAQLAHVVGQGAGRGQGVGVVLAQDPAAAGEGVTVQVPGGCCLAQLAQLVGEVVGGVEGVGVVLARTRRRRARVSRFRSRDSAWRPISSSVQAR